MSISSCIAEAKRLTHRRCDQSLKREGHGEAELAHGRTEELEPPGHQALKREGHGEAELAHGRTEELETPGHQALKREGYGEACLPIPGPIFIQTTITHQ